MQPLDSKEFNSQDRQGGNDVYEWFTPIFLCTNQPTESFSLCLVTLFTVITVATNFSSSIWIAWTMQTLVFIQAVLFLNGTLLSPFSVLFYFPPMGNTKAPFLSFHSGFVSFIENRLQCNSPVFLHRPRYFTPEQFQFVALFILDSLSVFQS